MNMYHLELTPELYNLEYKPLSRIYPTSQQLGLFWISSIIKHVRCYSTSLLNASKFCSFSTLFQVRAIKKICFKLKKFLSIFCTISWWCFDWAKYMQIKKICLGFNCETSTKCIPKGLYAMFHLPPSSKSINYIKYWFFTYYFHINKKHLSCV